MPIPGVLPNYQILLISSSEVKVGLIRVINFSGCLFTQSGYGRET
jgi:hypothetical protein